MNGHVTAWLEAYHDDELNGRRLRKVEAHLESCAACRRELERLEALAVALRAVPAAEGLASPDRFVYEVGLRLQRRPEQPVWQRALNVGWQLAPVGLLGAWAFVQTVLVVAGVLSAAVRVGVGGDIAASLLGVSQGVPGEPGLAGLSGAGLNDLAPVALKVLRSGGPLGWGPTLAVALLILIGVLYWSWLASWWAARRHLSPNGS
jgi:anti-sigma factor RsiW